MNRIIKFRAWHFGHKKMFSAEEMTEDQLAILPNGLFANIHGADTRLSKIFTHDEILPLQFTGLSDKNGKEIYEGDILRTDFNEVYFTYVQVKFGDCYGLMEGGCYGWYCELIEGHCKPMELGIDKACHLNSSVKITSYVVGNIYENSKLLKS